jgi:hypothetical protein
MPGIIGPGPGGVDRAADAGRVIAGDDGTRWAGVSHDEIWAMVQQGDPVAASEAASFAWMKTQLLIQSIEERLSAVVSGTAADWEGAAANAARGAVSALGQWAIDGAAGARSIGQTLLDQSHEALHVRQQMPEPRTQALSAERDKFWTDPGYVFGNVLDGFSDLRALEEQAENDAQRARELMAQYEARSRGENIPRLQEMTPPPQITVDIGPAAPLADLASRRPCPALPCRWGRPEPRRRASRGSRAPHLPRPARCRSHPPRYHRAHPPQCRRADPTRLPAQYRPAQRPPPYPRCHPRRRRRPERTAPAPRPQRPPRREPRPFPRPAPPAPASLPRRHSRPSRERACRRRRCRDFLRRPARQPHPWRHDPAGLHPVSTRSPGRRPAGGMSSRATRPGPVPGRFRKHRSDRPRSGNGPRRASPNRPLARALHAPVPPRDPACTRRSQPGWARAARTGSTAGRRS